MGRIRGGGGLKKGLVFELEVKSHITVMDVLLSRWFPSRCLAMCQMTRGISLTGCNRDLTLIVSLQNAVTNTKVVYTS
jgi:hypothetical protein